MIPNRWEF